MITTAKNVPRNPKTKHKDPSNAVPRGSLGGYKSFIIVILMDSCSIVLRTCKEIRDEINKQCKTDHTWRDADRSFNTMNTRKLWNVNTFFKGRDEAKIVGRGRIAKSKSNWLSTLGPLSGSLPFFPLLIRPKFSLSQWRETAREIGKLGCVVFSGCPGCWWRVVWWYMWKRWSKRCVSFKIWTNWNVHVNSNSSWIRSLASTRRCWWENPADAISFRRFISTSNIFFCQKRHVATILRINYHQPFKLDHVSSSNFSHILVGSCSPFVTSMARRRYAQMKVRRRSLKRCCCFSALEDIVN